MIKTIALPEDLRPLLEHYHVDMLVEKHEGWGNRYARDPNTQIALIGDFKVILPIWHRRESKIDVFKIAPSTDGLLLTIYLLDSTYIEQDGFVVIAEKIPNTDVYVAVIFHNSFWVAELWTRSRANKPSYSDHTPLIVTFGA
jgi:hypothetical protein